MIAMHEGEARRLRAELIHIDAVLRLFDPETDPEGLPIRKAFPRRMAYFAKGEVSRRVYDALREGTTAANELAEAAMTEKGISEDDRHVRRDFVNLASTTCSTTCGDAARLRRSATARECAGNSRRQSGICCK
jgi:hypothetical protein